MDCGGEVEVHGMAKRMEDGGGGGRPMIPSSSWSCPRLVGDGKTTVELQEVRCDTLEHMTLCIDCLIKYLVRDFI